MQRREEEENVTIQNEDNTGGGNITKHNADRRGGGKYKNTQYR
jgi:hypothetical protein